MMVTAIGTLVAVPSMSPIPKQRRKPAPPPSPGKWQPRPTSPAPTSTVDAEVSPRDGLLVELGALASDDVRRVAIRAQVIEWYLPMAGYLARRFNGRGEPLADLTQVAVIGLIKAVDRYDADRGVAFASYAIPTILGEVKRHFRDAAWNVRVPRRLQELKLRLTTVTEDLTHTLHRSPTTAELAAELGVGQREVLAARHCATAYRPLSFERAAPGSDDLRLIDSLGGPDPGIEAVDRRETLRLRLAELPERERRIITLRYFGGMTQAQIAAEVGVSQMQISRLLSQSLIRLHDGMLADADRVLVG